MENKELSENKKKIAQLEQNLKDAQKERLSILRKLNKEEDIFRKGQKENISLSNKQHDMIKGLGDDFKDFGNNIRDAAHEILGFAIGVRQLSRLFGMAKQVKEYNSEIFKLGVQAGKGAEGFNALSSATTNLTKNLGASWEMATGVVKTLSETNYIGNIEKAAVAATQFSRATGVSSGNIIDLQNELSKVGKFSDDASGAVLANIVKVQQANGITKEGMDSIVGSIKTMTTNMNGFGATKDQIKKMAVGTAKLVSEMEKVGISARQATQWIEQLTDPERIEENIGLYAQLGVSINDALSGDFDPNQMSAGMKDFGQRLKDMGPIAGKAYAQAFGVSYKEMIKNADLQEATEQAMTPEEKSLEALTELKTATQDIGARMDETMNKFSGLFKSLGVGVLVAIGIAGVGMDKLVQGIKSNWKDLIAAVRGETGKGTEETKGFFESITDSIKKTDRSSKELLDSLKGVESVSKADAKAVEDSFNNMLAEGKAKAESLVNKSTGGFISDILNSVEKGFKDKLKTDNLDLSALAKVEGMNKLSDALSEIGDGFMLAGKKVDLLGANTERTFEGMAGALKDTGTPLGYINTLLEEQERIDNELHTAEKGLVEAIKSGNQEQIKQATDNINSLKSQKEAINEIINEIPKQAVDATKEIRNVVNTIPEEMKIGIDQSQLNNALKKNNESFKKEAKEAAKDCSGIFKIGGIEFGNTIKGAAIVAAKRLGDSKIGGKISGKIGGIKTGLDETIKAGSEKGAGFGKKLKAVGAKAVVGAGKAVVGAGKAVVGAPKIALSGAKKLAGAIGGLAATLGPALIIGKILGKVFEKVKEKLADKFDKFEKMFDSMISAIADKVVPIVEQLMPIIEDVISTVFNALGPILGSLVGLVEPIGKLLGKIMTALKPVIESLMGMLASVVGFLPDLIGLLVDILIPILEPFLEVLKTIFDCIAPLIDILRGIMPIISKLSKIVSNILGFFIRLSNWLLQPILGALKKIASWFGKKSDEQTEAITENTEQLEKANGSERKAEEISVSVDGGVVTTSGSGAGATNSTSAASKTGASATNSTTETTKESGSSSSSSASLSSSLAYAGAELSKVKEECQNVNDNLIKTLNFFKGGERGNTHGSLDSVLKDFGDIYIKKVTMKNSVGGMVGAATGALIGGMAFGPLGMLAGGYIGSKIGGVNTNNNTLTSGEAATIEISS